MAGLPSTSANELFISGCATRAWTMAYPMRWVKLTLPPRPRARWLLITMRLSDEQLGRHGPHAGRGRHGSARRPCSGHDLGGDAADRRGVRAWPELPRPARRRARGLRRRLAALAGGGCVGGSARRARLVRCSRLARCSRSEQHSWRRRPAAGWYRLTPWWPRRAAELCHRRGLIADEEIVPGRVHAGGVGEVVLVHVVDDPLVRAEVRQRVIRRVSGLAGHGGPLPFLHAARRRR